MILDLLMTLWKIFILFFCAQILFLIAINIDSVFKHAIPKKSLIYLLYITSIFTNFLAVFLWESIFDYMGPNMIIFCVFVYMLLVCGNSFLRINLIKSGQSKVKLLMPDPENYNKKDDLTKEYGLLYSNVIGLIIGVSYVLLK